MAQALDMEQVDKALDGFTIPPRPDLLIKLQAEVEKPEPSIIEIAHLIGQDLAVTNFTLKVVNSPVFALSKKVDSIELACSFLGLNKVLKLVSSVMLKYAFLKDPVETFSTRLWDSSALLADACLAIAQYLDIEEPDDAYSIGMFNNAGMALIDFQIPEYANFLKSAYQQDDDTIGHLEEETFGSSHEVLGFLIAQSWGLNNTVSNVIAYHHSPSIILNTGSYAEKQLFSVLKLAEHLVAIPNLLADVSADHEWDKICHQVLDVLELEEYQLQDMGELLYGFGVSNIFHP